MSQNNPLMMAKTYKKKPNPKYNKQQEGKEEEQKWCWQCIEQYNYHTITIDSYRRWTNRSVSIEFLQSDASLLVD